MERNREHRVQLPTLKCVRTDRMQKVEFNERFFTNFLSKKFELTVGTLPI